MIKNVLKQSGIHFSGKVFGVVFSSSVLILLSRFLTPANYGQAMLGLTIILFGSIIGGFGLTQWYQKQEEERIAFATIGKLRLILSIITGIFLLCINAFLHWLPLSLAILIVLILIIHSFVFTATAYLIRIRKVIGPSLMQVFQAIPILIMIILKQHEIQVVDTFYAYIIGDTLVALILFPMNRLKDLFGETKPLFSSLVSSSKYAILNYTSVAYARADSFIVRGFLGETALGFYGLAYRYLEVFALFPSSLVTILFPVFAQSKKISKKHLTILTSIMAIIGFFVMCFIFIIAKTLILTLHGSAYISTITVLRILSVTLLLFFINAPLATFVQASDMVKKFLPFGIANTVLNVLLNIYFILKFGIIGAAYVMVITEISGLIINVYFTHKIFDEKNNNVIPTNDHMSFRT